MERVHRRRSLQRAAAALLTMATLTGRTAAQDCVHTGDAAWSEPVRTIVPGCRTSLAAPTNTLAVVVDERGDINVMRPGSNISIRVNVKPVEGAATASWAPDARSFLINDTQGADQSSVFRLFTVRGATLSEDHVAQRTAVARFRSRAKCAPVANDPNVWGVGWSSDDTEVYLVLQATTTKPCGSAGEFIGMIIRVSDDTVVDELSEAETKTRFSALLPPALVNPPQR